MRKGFALKEEYRDRQLLALFDWDGTVYPGFTLRSWTKFLVAQGLFSTTAQTQIADLFGLYYKGKIGHDELSNETSFVYAVGVSGQLVENISFAATEFIQSAEQRPYAFAGRVFNLLRSEGVQNIVISGVPAQVLRAYAKQFPLDQVVGLEIAIDELSKRFTNAIVSNPGQSIGKKLAVRRLPQTARILLAFGNSISDLPLFTEAEIGIVLNNKDDFPEFIRTKLISLEVSEVEAIVANTLTSLKR